MQCNFGEGVGLTIVFPIDVCDREIPKTMRYLYDSIFPALEGRHLEVRLSVEPVYDNLGIAQEKKLCLARLKDAQAPNSSAFMFDPSPQFNV